MTKRTVTKNVLLLALIGGGFGAACIALLRFADGPSKASTTKVMAGVIGTPTPTPDTTAQVQGQYAGFSYPGYFDAVSQSKTDSNALEQFSIADKADYRVSIQASVRPLPVGGLNEDSSYRLRSISPAAYKQSDVLAGQDRAVLMAKVDTTEQTLFVPHANMLLTIAITSGSTKILPAQIMAVVRPSVRWRP